MTYAFHKANLNPRVRQKVTVVFALPSTVNLFKSRENRQNMTPTTPLPCFAVDGTLAIHIPLVSD